MRTCHNNLLTLSNTKSLNYICGNFTFESLNLHRETFSLEKIVPQGLIRNTEFRAVFWSKICICAVRVWVGSQGPVSFFFLKNRTKVCKLWT